MKNTSGCYLGAGILAGYLLARAGSAEPAWFLLLIPAGVLFLFGIVTDHS